MDLDEDVPQDEKLRVSHLLHRLTCADTLVPDKASIKAEIESAVEEHGARTLPPSLAPRFFDRAAAACPAGAPAAGEAPGRRACVYQVSR
jgi:hypothetical protein